MVAYIRHLAVEQEKWLDDASFRDGVALCQAIPGATAMQTAAYVGVRTRGLPGAAVSFVGFGLPAFCFMMILSIAYGRTHDMPLVLSVFQGLRAVTVALVAYATLSFGKTSLRNWADLLIAAAAASLFGLRVNPILVILLAGLSGLLLHRGKRFPQTTAALGAPTHLGRRLVPLLLAVALALGLLFLADRSLFGLAILMFRIDLFAFGGGFASVPLMYHEIVEVRSWMDGATFVNGIALGQVTPGPIVITATFVGHWLRGALGAVVATTSIFLPSFLVLVAVMPYYDRLRASASFHRCISGILSSFVGLLLSVTIQFAVTAAWDTPRILLAAASFAALLLKVEVLWIVLAATVIALVAL